MKLIVFLIAKCFAVFQWPSHGWIQGSGSTCSLPVESAVNSTSCPTMFTCWYQLGITFHKLHPGKLEEDHEHCTEVTCYCPPAPEYASEEVMEGCRVYYREMETRWKDCRDPRSNVFLNPKCTRDRPAQNAQAWRKVREGFNRWKVFPALPPRHFLVCNY
ncbi:Oidioi.mRNA.OKI2018_I69.chr1.g3294.t1.cds [Oikopleura dioica]|uniref:Oidioi.mRNA.OKI2018_I69.chr1.g3294.t1.cds n=1 Tax=Oikopleura dioica TaxID=34765 RepID=A0ABN7STQ0_OIKDI|nr:Oidioi.mRNA.OKI2018_I69.chr1.g3294.t1.cds [Oikopleura dioica]